ncbi:MAG TPA: helix-turn-helix transcriptional regulator [Solirubrobacteraceae bacterium]|nr:helix-turn-helix transcriptional regulator [Solirubrobacteraceae bacterium]
MQRVGYRIAGESARLSPAPDLARASVLVFDVEASGIARASALARASDVALIGLLRQPPRDVLDGRLAAALLLRTLTPARLVSCLDAVSDGPDRRSSRELGDGFAWRRERVAARSGAELTGREITVLRLLAAGDSTRDIATRLSYSERTVKNIVHDVLSKLGGRTRAHAVALAVRDGVI